MLRISKITDYGTLLMTRMAVEPARVQSASELALGLGLGVPVVSKILKSLARHGLLVAARGYRGGYSLSRSPERISLADIVDALEEQPFGMTQCSAAAGLCTREADCVVRTSWRSINGIVRRALEDVSVASMLQPSAEVRPGAGRQQGAGQQPIVLERTPRRIVAGPGLGPEVARKRRKQPTRMQP